MEKRIVISPIFCSNIETKQVHIYYTSYNTGNFNPIKTIEYSSQHYWNKMHYN